MGTRVYSMMEPPTSERFGITRGGLKRSLLCNDENEEAARRSNELLLL